MIAKTSAAIAACLFVSANALAGMVDGPYVIWINLSAQPEGVDGKMRQMLDYKSSACWDRDRGPILFMRSKPAAINPALATRALLKREPAALGQLQALLKRRFGDEAPEGFDGIVVYADQPAPRMLGLTTGRARIGSATVDPAKGGPGLLASYCAVLPPITRRP
jgi:hypothetical protein